MSRLRDNSNQLWSPLIILIMDSLVKPTNISLSTFALFLSLDTFFYCLPFNHHKINPSLIKKQIYLP